MCSVYKGMEIKERNQQEKWMYVIQKLHIQITVMSFALNCVLFVFRRKIENE